MIHFSNARPCLLLMNQCFGFAAFKTSVGKTFWWKMYAKVMISMIHYDVIKWKLISRYRLFVRVIHRSPVNSPQKGQWCGALMFSLIYAWIKCCVNNLEAGDSRRHRAHYDVIVMTDRARPCAKRTACTYGHLPFAACCLMFGVA